MPQNVRSVVIICPLVNYAGFHITSQLRGEPNDGAKIAYATCGAIPWIETLA